MNVVLTTHDVLFLVLDTLRYDVAVREFKEGRTPNLARSFPAGWEERHSPGNFTFAAHHAFFAGFLPTPADPKADITRLFACRFYGSESTGPMTKLFEGPDWIRGLAGEGFRTLCIGGVGFFNLRTPLSSVLPKFFSERVWQERFGVTCRESAQHQFQYGARWLETLRNEEKALLFINVSALHQPNYFYARDEGPDDLDSHAAALRYVDEHLPLLIRAFERRSRPVFAIVTSDHGTAYGEDGFHGHRVAHPVVWTVPYADGLLQKSAA